MRIFWISALAVIIDQISKWAVVEYMYINQSIPLIGDWFRFTFTTNPGMAFGISFGPPGMVTILSLIATGLIIAYMYSVRRGYQPYLMSLALILGGALGNIIDRVFYGVIYEGGGLFTGEVVDFIHFNIWRGYVPADVPFIGGSYMALFPIWNVADMAIVLGVVGILMFQNRFHEARDTAALQPDAPLTVPPAEEFGVPLTQESTVQAMRAPDEQTATGTYQPPVEEPSRVTDAPDGYTEVPERAVVENRNGDVVHTESLRRET
jgi:signal peptidase II